MGDHLDGLGNRLTIGAVADPGSDFQKTYRLSEGSILDNRKLACSGFGEQTSPSVSQAVVPSDPCSML